MSHGFHDVLTEHSPDVAMHEHTRYDYLDKNKLHHGAKLHSTTRRAPRLLLRMQQIATCSGRFIFLIGTQRHNGPCRPAPMRVIRLQPDSIIRTRLFIATLAQHDKVSMAIRSSHSKLYESRYGSTVSLSDHVSSERAVGLWHLSRATCHARHFFIYIRLNKGYRT